MHQLKKTVLPAAALALAVSGLAAPATASVYILDFSGPKTGPDSICTNNIPPFATVDCASGGTFISQSYGDQPGVDVQYFTQEILNGVQSFQYWSSGYADLIDVAFYNPLSTISFVAQPGYSVGLAGLSLGWFGPTSAAFKEQVKITDLSTNEELYDSGLQTIPGSGNNALVLDFTTAENPSGPTSTSGLVLTFVTGGGNFAVDNVIYSAKTTTTQEPPGVIPLPAGLPLFLAGLGAFGLLRRGRA